MRNRLAGLISTFVGSGARTGTLSPPTSTMRATFAEAKTDFEAIEKEAEGISQSLILCAHTHIARAVRLGDRRLVVNPGSVGVPGYSYNVPFPHLIEAGTPDARYAILEFADASWRVTFRHVPYDHDAMAALARRNGDAEFASALSTGWIR